MLVCSHEHWLTKFYFLKIMSFTTTKKNCILSVKIICKLVKSVRNEPRTETITISVLIHNS